MDNFDFDDTQEDRKRYFVSVQARQILEDAEAAAYELEILATESQRQELRILLEELVERDEAQLSFYAMRPVAMGEAQDVMGDDYDVAIVQVYRLLYECGSEQTKRHIESMHIL